MKFVSTTAIVALSFLGISAIAGAIPMLVDPSGSVAHLPLSLLARTPFHSFLIPGLVLLFANGVLSLVILMNVFRRVRWAGLLVALQGCVLAIWITAEVIFFRTVTWLHFLYWSVALILLLAGWGLEYKGGSANSRP